MDQARHSPTRCPLTTTLLALGMLAGLSCPAAHAAEATAAGEVNEVDDLGVARHSLPPIAATSVDRLLQAAHDLQLEVFVQGASTRWVAHVRQLPDGQLLIPTDQLQHVGVLPKANAVTEEGWVALAQLPGVHASYEPDTQRLHIEAEDEAMVLRILNASQRPVLAADDVPVDIPHHTGAFINHMLSWQSGGEGWNGLRQYQSAQGLLEGTAYGRFGSVSSTHLLNATRGHGQGVDNVRLDTQWSWFDEQRLVTISAGDMLSSSLSWNRPVRLAGLQIRRNFAIRPDLITMPMLSGLSGSAAVPSTVEVYVNDAQRFSQDVPAGPFTVTNLPLITGGGTARLVLRDALGRETLSETPFYASSHLLAQGFSDFSLEAGVARHHFGTQSNAYEKRLVASGSMRYGLNDNATLEGHAQMGGQFAQAGGGAVFRLGHLGVAALAAAASRYTAQGAHETGRQFAGNMELEWAGIHVFAQTQHTFGEFNDLASITLKTGNQSHQRRMLAPARRMQQIAIGLPYWVQPSVNLTYTAMHLNDRQRTRLVGLNSSYRLGRRGYLTVSTYRDLERAHSLSVYAGLSWFFDRHLSASNALSYRQGSAPQAILDVSRTGQTEYGSLDWRMRATSGQQRMAGAQASYRSRIGRIEADVERRHGNSHGRVYVDGALVLAGGGVFLSNQIHHAFAVVDVGAPDVPVMYENNRIGRTDARGKLLLANLRAYERNLISIDPMHLPVDSQIPATRRVVSPRHRSGAVVDFNVATRPRVALLNVHDEDGQVIRAGTAARLNDDEAGVIVGYDGQIWLENISDHNTLWVTPAGKPACVVEFDAPPSLSQRLVIPDAICRSLP